MKDRRHSHKGNPSKRKQTPILNFSKGLIMRFQRFKNKK